MDKYEYKLKTEQMLKLMENGAYNRAAEIADSIDWKRVRNVNMLLNVSNIYEKIRDYRKSFGVLRAAYHRTEGSRKILYRLCTLAIKVGNLEEAIDYYDEYVQAAPKDPNQYILRYRLLRARRAPIEQQIRALEQFKKAEYVEEWAYELAKRYEEAGMTAECLEECDDLILWFSEGKYVYKAMELKMRYKPLTPLQQEKYDRRLEEAEKSSEREAEKLIDLGRIKAEEEENQRLFGKAYQKNDYVFKWPDGRTFAPDYVTHHFSKMLERYGMPHIRFHELRHSCASLLLNNGCGLKDVQEWMGHSDIQTTANIYGHLDTSRKQSLADKLTECLNERC